MTELNVRPQEQEPIDEVYEIVHKAVCERVEAESLAYERYITILRALSEAEILTLASGLGEHERLNRNQFAIVATDVIVNQPILAMILARRHFDDCTSCNDEAVVVINTYLHNLWTGRAAPADVIPEQILTAAKWHRDSHQRMLRNMTKN